MTELQELINYIIEHPEDSEEIRKILFPEDSEEKE